MLTLGFLEGKFVDYVGAGCLAELAELLVELERV